MSRWQSQSLIWGGVWSGIALISLSLYFAVAGFKEYIVSPIFYVVVMLMYAF